MRAYLYPAILAAILPCQSLTQSGVFIAGAAAQSTTPRQTLPNSAADRTQAGAEQTPLTEKQIEAFIAAQKTISAIVDELPEDQQESPSAQRRATLDQAVRKFGFKDYAEYEDVADNIDIVMEGFDEDGKASARLCAFLKDTHINQ